MTKSGRVGNPVGWRTGRLSDSVMGVVSGTARTKDAFAIGGFRNPESWRVPFGARHSGAAMPLA